VTVPDLYRALWRHKIFIIVLTAALVAAAYYLTAREPKTYKATALVRVQQKIHDPAEAFLALQTGGRLAQTYANITTTSTIVNKIYKALGGKVPYSDMQLSASQVQDLELMSISAVSRTPQNAALVANAAPVALKSFIHETGTLDDQVIFVQKASVPSSPNGPKIKLNVIIALVLGLIFNSALALLLDILGDRVSDPEEFERIAGRPVLARVPLLDLGYHPVATHRTELTQPPPAMVDQ
jgi:capsular polysaccharide biosynthesis protein